MIISRVRLLILFISLVLLPCQVFAEDQEFIRKVKKMGVRDYLKSQEEFHRQELKSKTSALSNTPISLINDTETPVVYFGVTKFGKSFPKEPPEPDYENLMINMTPKQMEELTNRIPKSIAAQSLPNLPSCKNSEVRRIEIAAGSSVFDYLFYSFTDPDQKEKAKKWSRMTIPYYAPKIVKEDAEDTEATLVMYFAVQFGVKCLPSRMHFTSDENQRKFLEVREGQSAWQEDL